MALNYEVDLSVKGIEQIEKIFDKLDNLLNDERLHLYIGEKCMEAVRQISANKLTTLQSQEDIETSNYMNNHHLEVNNGVIYIYNDSVIDTSTKEIFDRSRYPLQLSLAKIVEYGIGYTGSISANSEADNWEYDVNNHGYKGWYYKNNSGQMVWTNGFAGRYIYLELKHYIEENIVKWISEYIKRYL